MHRNRKFVRRSFLALAAATGVGVFLLFHSYWDAGLVGSAVVAVATAPAVMFFAPKQAGRDRTPYVLPTEQMSPAIANGTIGGLRGITSSRQPSPQVRDNGGNARR